MPPERDPQTWGWSMDDRVTRLEVMQANLTTQLVDTNREVSEVARRVDARPSWAVTMMISFLATAVGVLATVVAALLTVH